MTLLDTAADTDTADWIVTCSEGRLLCERGVAVLVEGRQVALFLLRDGSVHAIDNHDPCTGVAVLSRGLVGDHGGRRTVASPLYKQRFDLRTGECLDDAGVRVAVHEVRIRDGAVEVRVRP